MILRPGSLYVPSTFSWGGMKPGRPLGKTELLLPFRQPRPSQDLQEKAKAEGMSSGAGPRAHAPAHLWTASGACPSFPKSVEPVCTWGSRFVHAAALSEGKLVFSPLPSTFKVEDQPAVSLQWDIGLLPSGS